MQFSTRLDGSVISYPYDTETPESAFIVWEADFDFRGWGVKDIDITIRKIHVYSNTEEGTITERTFLTDSIIVEAVDISLPIQPKELIFNDSEAKIIF